MKKGTDFYIYNCFYFSVGSCPSPDRPSTVFAINSLCIRACGLIRQMADCTRLSQVGWALGNDSLRFHCYISKVSYKLQLSRTSSVPGAHFRLSSVMCEVCSHSTTGTCFMYCLFVSRQGREVERAADDQALVKLLFLQNDRREKTVRRELLLRSAFYIHNRLSAMSAG